MFNLKVQLRRLITIFLTLLILPIYLALAEGELRTVSVDSNSCTPREEICGSGIDEDCDGVDLKCPGDDGDRDGFPASQDCDDGDKFVYPGVSVACKAACGDGVKTCKAGGYTTCTCTPLCEKLAGGRCFYVDPVKGSDSNSGSLNSPLKTLKRVASYSGTPPPSNKIDLVPGDVIYLMSGIYNQVYQFEIRPAVLALNQIHGTSSAPIIFKAYPGNSPTFKLSADAAALIVWYSSWIKFEGLILDGSYEEGAWISDSDQIEISNSIIRNTDGIDNNNIAAVKLTKSLNVKVHHNIINDNYDRTNADTGGMKTENSRNIVLFGGKNQHFHHNLISQSNPTSAQKTGECLSSKHSADFLDSILEINDNIFINCYGSAITLAGHGGRIHHNLIIDSDMGVYFHAQGQSHPPFMGNNIVEYNTLVNTPLANTTFYNAKEFNGTVGTNTIRFNIVQDDAEHNINRGGISMEAYGLDDTIPVFKSTPYITSNDNCYFNKKGDVLFPFYAETLGSASSDGEIYSFEGWKAFGFDQNSYNEDPEISYPYFTPKAGHCSTKGLYSH